MLDLTPQLVAVFVPSARLYINRIAVDYSVSLDECGREGIRIRSGRPSVGSEVIQKFIQTIRSG